VRLLTRLAEIHDRRGNVDEAIAVYSGMLEKNPNNLVAANNLASLLVDRKGDPASIKRAIEIASRFENSDQPVYVDTLGWAQYKAGNIQKAVELLKRAADKAPDIPVIRYHLGLAYQQQGDKAAARTNLEAALKRAPNFPEADSARAALAAMK
jgi:tetratricopeptide (TPR) repeat protein